MQILLLFNKNIFPRWLWLKTPPGLQLAGLRQLNSQRLAKGKKQVAAFKFSIDFIF